jgi:hypothetical protein
MSRSTGVFMQLELQEKLRRASEELRKARVAAEQVRRDESASDTPRAAPPPADSGGKPGQS